MSNLSIYVADIAAYNAGTLRGEWLDVSGFDKSDLRSSIDDLLSKWEAEEWGFFDFEGFPYNFGEYESLDNIAAYIQAVETYEHPVVNAYLNFFDINELEMLCERYLGEFESDTDFVHYWLEETGELQSVNESLRSYFDAEAWLRDAVLNGTFNYLRVGGKTYVFTGW